MHRPDGAPARALLPLVRLASVAALLAGCPTRDVTRLDSHRSTEQVTVIPASDRPDLDLLFVIDDSSSMAGEQRLLGENFPRFVGKLEEARGGLPDLHLGVVSSDLGIAPFELPAGETGGGVCAGEGDGGALLRGPPGSDCALDPGDRFLRDSVGPDGRETNYPPGELAETFACMAQLGSTGCGFEQHLEAMRRALDGHPANQGFLRGDALLAVVIIADEDDCSARDPALFDPDRDDLGPQQDFRCFEQGVACEPDLPRQPGDKVRCQPREDSALVEPVGTYVDFLRELKRDEGRIVVTGIIGDAGRVTVSEREGPGRGWTLESTCSTPDGGRAEPAIRQHALLDAFPVRSTAQTICPADGDLSGALEVIGQVIGQALGSPCLPGRMSDTDDDVPGVQPECAVSEVTRYGTADSRDRSVPPCGAGDDPCARFEIDPACSTETQVRLVVERAGPLPPDVTWVVRCEMD